MRKFLGYYLHRSLLLLFVFLTVLIVGNTIMGNTSDQVVISIVRTTMDMFYSSIVVIWSLYLHDRFLDKKIVVYLSWICLFIILWMILDTSQTLFIMEKESVKIFLYYLNYLPVILIPTISFLTVYIADGEVHKLDYLKWIIWITSTIFFTLIMTNNYHHLVFIFDNYDSLHTSGEVNVVFYALMIWIWSLLVVTLLNLVRFCPIKDSRRKIWFPILVAIVGSIMMIFVSIDYITFIRMPELYSLTYVVLFESSIQIGLLQNNIRYDDLLVNGNLPICIVDNDGNKIVSSSNYESSKADTGLKMSQESIRGGNIMWAEDLKHADTMTLQLNEINKYLAEQQQLIAAENDLKKREAATEAKVEIYNKIRTFMRPQMERVRRLLASENFDEILPQVCVIVAYVKRRSNLMLLLMQKECHESEILNSLRESLDYLKLSGVFASLSGKTLDNLANNYVIEAYDCFENIIEEYFHNLQSLMVTVSSDEQTLTISLMLQLKDGKEYSGNDIHVTNTFEDETNYLKIKINKGGKTNR